VKHCRFGRNLIARSPKTPVTVALVAINTLVFIAMGISSAGWFLPNAVALSIYFKTCPTLTDFPATEGKIVKSLEKRRAPRLVMS
jgi:hypothetical protein